MHYFTLVLVSICSLMLWGCSEPSNEWTFSIEPVSGENNIECPSFAANKTNEKQWTLGQFQIYIHSMVLIDASNTQHEIQLKNKIKGSADKNKAEVGLLSYFCGELAESSPKLYFNTNIEKKSIKAVQFAIGVPFHLNHLNPLTQSSPLNQPDMFWAWQNGYKFTRIELDKNDKRFRYHLGSVGCESAAPVRPPSKPCRQPNRITISLDTSNVDVFKDNEINLKLNTKTLLQGIEQSKNIVCMSDYDNSVCPILNKNLSMAFEL